MTITRLLVLALALAVALDVALLSGILAYASGTPAARAVLVGGGAAATVLTVFFTALPSYQ